MQPDLFTEDKHKKESNAFLWEQFAKLGEMMGDGLHHEEPWIAKEYGNLMRVLVPETIQIQKKRKQKNNQLIDAQIVELISHNKCIACGGGALKQARSGSKILYCTVCKARYKAKPQK